METTVLLISLSYLIVGISGILLNAVAAALMMKDKEMRNATYSYMIQQCLCDIIVLLSAATYTGFALLCPILQNDTTMAIFGYSTGIGWYAGSYFMVLISYSRCVQLVWSHKLNVLFSKRMIFASIIGIYLCPTLFYLYSTTIRRPLIFFVSNSTYSWTYNVIDPLGKTMAMVNITSNIFCAFLITVFNSKSLHWVRKTRMQIQTLESKENRRREVRLFFQCAITGTMYTLAVVVFFIISSLQLGGEHVAAFVITHLGWMMVHLQNPLIYFAVNSRLRRRLRPLFGCGPSEETLPSVRQVSVGANRTGPSVPTA